MSCKDIILPQWETIPGGIFDRLQIYSNSLTIPECVKVIEDYAFSYVFQNCKDAKLTLNEGLEKVGYGAFERMPLKELVLPSSIKIIGPNAFERAEVENLILPDGIKSIGFVERDPDKRFNIDVAFNRDYSITYKGKTYKQKLGDNTEDWKEFLSLPILTNYGEEIH